MMKMEPEEVKRYLKENPQLQEKALNAWEEAGDDVTKAALYFVVDLTPEEQDTFGVADYGREVRLQVLEPFMLAVRDQTATDDASTVPGDESYMDVLSSLPSTDCDYSEKLMFLKYTNGSGQGKTFFVRTGDVTALFGSFGGIPPSVYVTVAKKDVDKVHVYNQHSGAGKTVELCCSAYIRGADLAIYHRSRVEDEIQADEIAKVQSSTKDVDFRGALRILAETIVKRIVGEAVEWNKDVFLALKQQCGISNELKLVLAIDDASTCRNLVRAIVWHGKDLGVTAASEFQSLLEWKVDMKVLFSVAGTGAAPADIGSSSETFTIVQPSISISPESVYDALRSGHENC